MPHYSFVIPADEGWHLKITGGQLEVALITNKIDPFIFQIKLMRNLIFDENMKHSPANIVAKDFRELEKRTMIEQGANKGLYQLKDLTMGKEKIGGKMFYTMNYIITSKSGSQNASLYLFFPKAKDNDYFIVAHYAETIPANAFLVKSYKPDFLSTLASLSIK